MFDAFWTALTSAISKVDFLWGILAGLGGKILYDSLSEPRLATISATSSFLLRDCKLDGRLLSRDEGPVGVDVLAYRLKITNKEKFFLNTAARNCVAWLDLNGATEPYQLSWVGSRDTITINVGDTREVDLCGLVSGSGFVIAPSETGYKFPLPRILGRTVEPIRATLRVTCENGRATALRIIINGKQNGAELEFLFEPRRPLMKLARFHDWETVRADLGWLVAFVYVLFGALRICTVTYWWGHWPSKKQWKWQEKFWIDKYKKATPSWQDSGIALVLGLVIADAVLHLYLPPLSLIPLFLTNLLLLDMVCFHVNLLWLDNIYQTLAGGDPRIWNHLRVLLNAFLNLLESVVLFAILYNVCVPLDDFPKSLFASAVSGFTFNFPDQLQRPESTTMGLWCLQEVLSLFLVLVVLASLSAQAFKRHEIVEKYLPRKGPD